MSDPQMILDRSKILLLYFHVCVKIPSDEIVPMILRVHWFCPDSPETGSIQMYYICLNTAPTHALSVCLVLVFQMQGGTAAAGGTFDDVSNTDFAVVFVAV